MAVCFEKEAYDKMAYVPYHEGKHSKFKLCDYHQELHLVKEFVRTSGLEEAKEQVQRLLAFPKVPNTGYPLDVALVNNEIVGYISPWFYKACSHSHVLHTSLPVFTTKQKQKAVLDTTKQLKEFHQLGFIMSDVRLANHLIDEAGGHLIDFEDTLIVGQEKKCPLPFHFYHYKNGSLKVNFSSQEEDKRKQALTHISFLLGVDLEYALYILQEYAYQVIDCFQMEPTFKKVLQEVFWGENIPYFDAYIPLFQDEEKNKNCGKKVYHKIQKDLRIK